MDDCYNEIIQYNEFSTARQLYPLYPTSRRVFVSTDFHFYSSGLDARVHYNSRTETEETISFDTTKDGTCWVSSTKKIGGKKATLCAWIHLQSIPQETIITPNILQFLEQALEPIPTLGVREQARVSEDLFEDSSSGSHNGHVTNPVGSSFPVDVIVHFHMQSSTFRFSCVPVNQ